MAVIVCPHCKKYISSKLSTCPECGGDVSRLVEEQVEEKVESQNVVSGDVQQESSIQHDNAEPVLSQEPSESIVLDEPQIVEEMTQKESDDTVESASVSTNMDDTVSTDSEVSDNESSDNGNITEDSVKEEEPKEDVVNEDKKQAVPMVKKPWYALSARRIVTIAFFFILISGITYFLIADHRRTKGYEQRAYERLNGCTNLLWYEDYIIRFPDGEHIDEVKKMYAEAQKEHEEFYQKAAGGDRESLLKFIKEHPSSPYVKVCESRIDSLDWDVALSENNIAGYQRYLELHPEGAFAVIASESKTRLTKLEVTNEEKSMLSGSIDTFLAAMTSGDENRVDALVSSPMTFCGVSDATGSSVVGFCKSNFQHDDIIGVHFSVSGGLGIKKKPSDIVSGAYDFIVNAQLDAVLNRSNVDSTGVQVWKMTAVLTPDRKFRSVNIVKQ